MKLKKLREEVPKYEGKFWSYSKRKFVDFNEWMQEQTPCAYNRGPFKIKEEEKENVQKKI